MNGRYLIPANSKKSEMILGLFTGLDAFLFGIGVGLTLIMMFTIHTDSLVGMLLILLPAMVSAFLVFPVPHYHNILQLITNIYTFYFVRQRTYKWRGWCYKNGSDDK